MLKSCSRCGRIHTKGYKCRNLKSEKRDSVADKFRNTQMWRRKSREIKERDGFMCQICKRKLYNTLFRYNSENISTHHIIPLKEAWERRLDGLNLITLCGYHHELAERGKISRGELLEMAAEQEAA